MWAKTIEIQDSDKVQSKLARKANEKRANNIAKNNGKLNGILRSRKMRELYKIAQEIQKEWPNANYAARPFDANAEWRHR